MSVVTRTAEERISNFFSKYGSASESDCKAFASKITGSLTVHTATQGAFSYTVASERHVVQFRGKVSPLDIGLLNLAKRIHGGTVAWTFDAGRLPEDAEVLVYCMEKLPGQPYSQLSGPCLGLSALVSQRRMTLKGFARFFAQSWNKPQPVERNRILQTKSSHQQKLLVLLNSLPKAYGRLLSFCLNNLDAAFHAEMPWALTHGDLCDTNIMIDSESGELTGIIDWAEGDVLPFGMALWGLETLLGYMDVGQGRWVYYSQREEMEKLFWHYFLEDAGPVSGAQGRGISVIRLIGIFFRHGFKFDGAKIVPKDGSWDLSFLQGQLLGHEDRWMMSWHSRLAAAANTKVVT
ncbi:hypothetical protein Cob_v008416 [Colletotrichum orbiculare MAFF 240422]|uniref:Aminoglycoside phosphotransferase domain-containing protein n=1 Tax=Colletotrichum orbiculare (strain 104-T / ATCC 96160 / CBS 514.97 / LARS 414 / MAFF 240422) TaxID=1213857 RepID=N4VRY5_COLOR|nr:hypothetical protein Cob_v008416 [Colletotrichum orbiculare MAFF 240422]